MKYLRFIQNLFKRKYKKKEITIKKNSKSFEVIYCINYLDTIFESVKLYDNTLPNELSNISISKLTDIDMTTYAENGRSVEEDILDSIIDWLKENDYIKYINIVSNIVIKITSTNYDELYKEVMYLFNGIKIHIDNPSDNIIYLSLTLNDIKYIDFNKLILDDFYYNMIIDIFNQYGDMEYIDSNYYDNGTKPLSMIAYNTAITEPNILINNEITFSNGTIVNIIKIDPVLDSNVLLRMRNMYLCIKKENNTHLYFRTINITILYNKFISKDDDFYNELFEKMNTDIFEFLMDSFKL